MTNRNEEIRRDNRKALPKFLLLLLTASLIGGGVGFCAAFFGLDQMAGGLAAAGVFFSTRVAHWLAAAFLILIPAVTLPLYLPAKRRLDSWDGEDEAVSDWVERRLSLAMWANGLMTIIVLFLGAAGYAGMMEAESVTGLFVSVVALLGALAEVIFFQQRMVDLSKRMAPEKRGSVYDIKFQKTWLDSCDEAEKILIGRCAYKAYTAANMTCLALWIIFTITGLFLNTGILPVLTVCIVWGVTLSVYCWNAYKLSAPGSTVL